MQICKSKRIKGYIMNDLIIFAVRTAHKIHGS
jgi:hypothetical protein